MDIRKLLKSMVAFNSSGLYLQVGSEPMIRIERELKALKLPKIDSKTLEEMVFALLNTTQEEELKIKKELLFTFELDKIGRFRAIYSYSSGGLICTFGVIPVEIPSIDHFLPQKFKKLIDYPSGIVIVSGGGGTGSTTTAASMIQEINFTRGYRISVLGNPVEFVHNSVKSLVTHIDYYDDSFESSLERALMHESDVIYIDRLDTKAKILGAIKAADSNRLVVASMNFGSIEIVFESLLYYFKKDDRDYIAKRLANLIKSVTIQALAPKIGGGKIATHDIMTQHPSISSLIAAQSFSTIASRIKDLQNSTDMQLQSTELFNLVKNGVITESNALAVAYEENELRQLFK